MMKKVLIIAAHPDDEVLGCGGTIATHARQGGEVYCLILGEGATSRQNPQGKVERESEVKQLRAQAGKAAKMLGIREVFFRDLPDNCFDTVPLLDVVKVIEEHVKRLEPKVIYTHHGGDLNIDHVTTHRAVLTATRPMKEKTVREIYVFEVASSTEWAFHQFEPHFRPNVFVEISETLSLKIKAMSLYKTESRIFPHPRSPKMMQAIARRWGSVAGCEAAEAFELIRAIR
jgi:LmbE family N-acetylglucosaminyl deacetylase